METVAGEKSIECWMLRLERTTVWRTPKSEAKSIKAADMEHRRRDKLAFAPHGPSHVHPSASTVSLLHILCALDAHHAHLL